MRTFDTGATRNVDTGKHDFEGFLSPLALERFAEYMTKHRQQADGTIRDSDNWQRGIPMDAYMKSGWRHFFDWWKLHRMSLNCPLSPELEEQLEESLTALLFNLQGYLHEHLKRKHGTWSYILLQEAAKESAEEERRELAHYEPDTRPQSEGNMLPRDQWGGGCYCKTCQKWYPADSAHCTITPTAPEQGDAYEPEEVSPTVVSGRSPNWWMDPIEEMHHELAPLVDTGLE